MMKRALLLLLLLALPVTARAAELRLSAAASMTEVVGELATAFTARHPAVKLIPNFGASGALVRQITAGAPADLFISANPEWMQQLVTAGKVAPATVRPLAGNSLVFVGLPGLPVTELTELAGVNRLALGSPKSVPAGSYAQQALTAAGIYPLLERQNRLVLAQDVRQALMYADRGEVDGAFVYRTDAALAQHAVVLFTVPPSLHSPITYPMGLTVEGAGKAEARALLEFLGSDEARIILRKHRFIVE